MPVEAGSVIEGKVTGILKFGAFVELPEGKSGMVHISEVADEYVKDINEHLKENQLVKVKVLSLDNKGKISLSIKQANENGQSGGNGRNGFGKPGANGNGSTEGSVKSFGKDTADGSKSPVKKPFERSARTQTMGRGKVLGPDATFDDKLSKYLKDSEEKIHDLKKNFESKRGNGGYRKH